MAILESPVREEPPSTAARRSTHLRTVPRSASRVSRLALLLLLLLTLWPALPAQAGSDWVEYTDASATRISAAAAIGVADTEEKDLVLGDFDRDGDTDLVILRKLPFSNPGPRRGVLFMNESGVMVDRTNSLAPDFLVPTDDRDGTAVDVDGDGWLDLVVAGTFGEPPRVVMNLGENLGGDWLGFDYDATAGRLPIFSPAPNFCSVAAGDVNGDNKPDLYFTDYDTGVEDRLLINNGSGFFADETAARLTPEMVFSAFALDSQIADINGDGFSDIVKDNATGSFPPPGFSPRVSVLYNDGTGHFNFRDDIYTQAPYSAEVADFTQDGKLDLFVVDDGQDRFLINQGNDAQGHADFTSQAVATSPATSFFGGAAKFADLDNDGILDVMVADVDTDFSGCDRRLALLRGTGTPPNISYADPLVGAARPWLLNGVFDIAALHINNDGVLDLWIATCTGNRVFLGASPTLFRDGFEAGNTSSWSFTTP